MKKNIFLWMSALLLMLAGCSSDDNDTSESTLYHKAWKLVSYGNESNAVLKEAKGFEYVITFHPDGTYTGWAYGNQMGGKYNCTGHIISLSHPDITKVYYEDSDPDDFYLTHLCDVSTYAINDGELRLYYSKDEYFKYRIESVAFADDGDDNNVSSQECRYSYQNIFPSDADKIVTTQDSWTITTYANMITRAEFNSNPPSSAELFFKDKMPLSVDNVLKFGYSLKNPLTNYKHFDQLYKGIQVNRCGYVCNYDENDMLKSIEGAFVPIDDLDVNPTISKEQAKHIIVKYLHLNDSETPVQLQITPFYTNGIIDVRLTYVYGKCVGCFAYYECFVDAHSGEMLSSDFPSNRYSSY